MTMGQGAAGRPGVIAGGSAVTVAHRRLSAEVVHRAHAAAHSGAGAGAFGYLEAFFLEQIVAAPMVLPDDVHTTNSVGWGAV